MAPREHSESVSKQTLGNGGETPIFNESRESTWRVAVLHQGGATPAIGGVSKPPKPGGYKDSSSDIAYALRDAGIHVALPGASSSPDPASDDRWSFPDTEDGILDAINVGKANVLFSNTSLFATHPLISIAKIVPNVRFVGQKPADVEKFEDKNFCNQLLAENSELKGAFPEARLVYKEDVETLMSLKLPAVIKPVRGSGSHSVKVVNDEDELKLIATEMWRDNDAVLLEEYLSGEEITLSVMPPGNYDEPIGQCPSHWALPVVSRFNHINGIAPYNGVVAVAQNSQVIPGLEQDATYSQAQRRSEIIAGKCRSFSPIRIDARRPTVGASFKFFDVNMKPNATGPGRPGRGSQLSLTGIAAKQIGWSYQTLLRNMIRNSKALSTLL